MGGIRRRVDQGCEGAQPRHRARHRAVQRRRGNQTPRGSRPHDAGAIGGSEKGQGIGNVRTQEGRMNETENPFSDKAMREYAEQAEQQRAERYESLLAFYRAMW